MSKISNLKNYFGFHLVEMTSDKYNLENPELDINAENSLERQLAENIAGIVKRAGGNPNVEVERLNKRKSLLPNSNSPRRRVENVDKYKKEQSQKGGEGRESR